MSRCDTLAPRHARHMSDEITPFRIEIPDADLDDLRRRLRQTRWPEAATVGSPWASFS